MRKMKLGVFGLGYDLRESPGVELTRLSSDQILIDLTAGP